MMEGERALPTIAVVMPAHNAATFLPQSLPPLVRLLAENAIQEIIVVDDSSGDGTGATASAMGAVALRSENGPIGPAAARNLGVDRASSDIIWFVDADVVVKPDGPALIRRALGARQASAVIGSYDDAPAAGNFLSQYKNLVHHHYHHRGEAEAATFWTGCGAVWRDDLLAMGGFEPTPGRIDDVEFGYRLISAGRRIRFVSQLQGKHLKVWRFADLMRTEIFSRAIPWAELLMQHDTPRTLNVAPAERIRAAVAALGAMAVASALIGIASWWLPAVLLVLAFAVNTSLFRLFHRRKGLLFAVRRSPVPSVLLSVQQRSIRMGLGSAQVRAEQIARRSGGL